MLDRLPPFSRVASPPCPAALSPQSGRAPIEALPTLVFERILQASSGSTYVAVAMGQLSHALRQQSFDALLHALRTKLAHLRRAQPAPALLPQAQWLSLAHDLQHLIAMANNDMGLRPMPSPWLRWMGVTDAMRQWFDGDINGYTMPEGQICEGIAHLSQRDVFDAARGHAFRIHAASAHHRERVALLAGLARELRALGPDVLRKYLAPWAHSEQCRHHAHADIAVERIVQVYATGRRTLRLAALKLCSMPPCIELLALLQSFDISYNPGVQARPSAVISALPDLKYVSYSHFRETIRPGRPSRFLDLDDLDPPQ